MTGRLRKLLEWLRRTMTPGDGVAARTVNGGIWVALINVSDRVLQLVMVLFVAALIGPAEFGLMGIALLTLSALRRLTKLGIDASLIQRAEENVDRYLDTAWSLQILRGVVLTIAAFLFAPVIATAFGEPRAEPLIQVLAVTTILQGLANPGIMYFQKDLEFHRQFAYTMSGRFVEVAIAAGYAIVYGSVWALVFGHVAGRATSVGVSYFIHEYRPSLSFSMEYAREMLGYGKWIFGSEILSFLTNEGDDAFVGWFLGAAALGLYQMAYRISNAPATEISHTVSRVVFPAYSKLQDDLETLRGGYYNSLQLIAFVTLPASVGILLVMPSFVEAFLGGEWVGMILAAQILALYGLTHSVRTATTPLFRAMGRPDLDTKIRVVKLAVIAVLIYPVAAAYGLEGVALVILANSLVATPIAHLLATRLVEGRHRDLVAIFGYPTVGSLVMGGAVIAAQGALGPSMPILEFAVSVLVGVISYAVVMLLIERQFEYGMTGIVDMMRDSLA